MAVIRPSRPDLCGNQIPPSRPATTGPVSDGIGNSLTVTASMRRLSSASTEAFNRDRECRLMVQPTLERPTPDRAPNLLSSIDN